MLAVLFAVSLNACGTEKNSDANTGQKLSDDVNAETSDKAQTELADNNADTAQSENAANDAANGANDSDTDVTSNSSGANAQAPSKVTVAFEKTIDEIKSDNGTVICTNSVQMPIVNIEGAEDIAKKINADIAAYYDTLSADGTVSMAREDYAASLGEDGWNFLAYSTDISAKATRLDDAVISFQITLYDYAGGAHGNYASSGRNYSAKTGELLAFDEISGDYAAFHATVLDYMINLADTPAYKDKLFGPPSKNDLDSALFDGDNWIFTKSGISFLAAPYLLGPFASGEIAFMLPYEKAYDLGLKDDFRYSGNFVDEHYYIYKYDPETFAPIVDGTPDELLVTSVSESFAPSCSPSCLR